MTLGSKTPRFVLEIDREPVAPMVAGMEFRTCEIETMLSYYALTPGTVLLDRLTERRCLVAAYIHQRQTLYGLFDYETQSRITVVESDRHRKKRRKDK